MENWIEQIRALEAELSTLPIGYISKKTIQGKVRYYRQWTENGKVKSQYIKNEEYDAVSRAIARRREILQQLKELKAQWPTHNLPAATAIFETHVVIGEELQKSCRLVQTYAKRDCFPQLMTYLNGTGFGRVCVLYGLRRTGKTTMLFQAISELPDNQSAYIKARTTDTMAMLDRDLKKLAALGYRYFFLDEVTLLEDFIDSAAVLSDIYAMQGLKIVLSGTDSLGFWLAEHEELYDRAKMIHTTIIPFGEHARLLGIGDIDEYIRYGGTLRAGEIAFDDEELRTGESSFRDDESTRRYIDTAICKNIQHSLACCEGGGHFRHLADLYDAGELTNAINCIIESMNKRFLVSTVEKRFRSADLGITRNNLRKETDPEKKSDALDQIDEAAVLQKLKALLDIREKDDLTVTITPAHLAEIKEYLRALDLIMDRPLKTDSAEDPAEYILFTQPGMRYCQAQALVHSLLQDWQFRELSEREKQLVTDRLLDDVKGRMMEDILLLESSMKAKKNQSVFKLQFDRGEFDMVIYDAETDSCAVYEVKHSDKIAPEQYRHLCDAELCRKTERRFGKIAKRTVLYRGTPTVVNTDCGRIDYENAADYLKNLLKNNNIHAKASVIHQ